MSGRGEGAAPDAGGPDGTWVLCAAQPGSTVRCVAPAEVCAGCDEAWVELRPLSYREALTREGQGVTEHYELTEGGTVLGVSRRYDLVAMAAYDLDHCVVDYSLPLRTQGGETVTVRRPEDRPPSGQELLDRLDLRTAEWLRECLDRVNLRDRVGQDALERAQKK
jgi:hypothetical protein